MNGRIKNGSFRNSVLGVALLIAGNAAAAGPADGCAEENRSPLAAVAALVEKPINPSCKAEPVSKTYPSRTEPASWYNRTVVEVRCHYVCTSDNFPTMTLAGSRTTSFFTERGHELACFGIPYEERYNNGLQRFILIPMAPKSFNPGKSDVKELKDWVAGKPWGN